jgi:histone-arginine methyltransferase CARM1
VPPASLLTHATAQHVIDFARDDPSSLDAITLPLDFLVERPALCHGLAAWFTVDFEGSVQTVTLDTGPHAPGTHWYQCRLLLREPLAVNAGQRLTGSLRMTANERYSYHLLLSLGVAGSEATTASGQPVASHVAVNLADQQYSFGGCG